MCVEVIEAVRQAVLGIVGVPERRTKSAESRAIHRQEGPILGEFRLLNKWGGRKYQSPSRKHDYYWY